MQLLKLLLNFNLIVILNPHQFWWNTKEIGGWRLALLVELVKIWDIALAIHL
jgi:hypothetical protein